MLLNITVENFRSYDKAQTLSLIASENNGINSVKIGDLEVRKSAVIYGANASGKSNLIKAVILLQELLQSDWSFALSRSGYKTFFENKNPTKIGIDFENNGQIFTYTFVFNKDKIQSETLMDADEKLIYARNFVDKNYNYNIEQLEFLLNQEQLTVKDQVIKAWQVTTTDQQLFLRRCAENGSQNLHQLVQALRDIKIRENPYMTNNSHMASKDLLDASNFYQQNSDKSGLIEKLNSIGTGLDSLEVVDKDMPMQNGEVRKSRTINSHYLRDGRDVTLSFGGDESDGTIKFYNYLLALLEYIVRTDGVLIVDELETHFHPLLVEEIIKAIHHSKSKAQLIFTTHNPILLSEHIFERDQIYFAEKNKNQSTELYSLVDITNLKDSDNIRNEYLAGNLGAIPYFHSLDLGMDK